MQSDLLELKNLGNTSINWLRTIGINSRDDLNAIGPVEAYTRIKQRDIKVSKVLLYALYGALNDLHWNDLPSDLKQQLLQQADQQSTEGNSA